MKSLYVYILLCSDDSYYVGVTNDLDLRLSQHNKGLNPASYTYKRRPVDLQFYEIFSDPLTAINFETRLKKWSRRKKKALILENWDRLKELSTCMNESKSENK